MPFWESDSGPHVRIVDESLLKLAERGGFFILSIPPIITARGFCMKKQERSRRAGSSTRVSSSSGRGADPDQPEVEDAKKRLAGLRK